MSDSLFPEIEPYAHGLLEVTGGHRIYYEECGNHAGQPVLFLHGGPGSGCNPGHRRFFDPRHYRIILFDQRGCGRSLPFAELRENTTASLIADIERLRAMLKIERWLLFGGSWGSTLALAYAEAHPQAASGLILRGIFLGNKQELDWYCYGLKIFAPEAWSRFSEFVPEERRNDIFDFYYHAIHQPDARMALAAARAWNAYESELMKLGELQQEAKPGLADEEVLGRARVQTHYLFNCCFLSENQLVLGLARIRRLPASIVHGRFDMVCPVATAYTLHNAWPEARFTVVENAGHSASTPALAAALVAATERFKSIVPGDRPR